MLCRVDRIPGADTAVSPKMRVRGAVGQVGSHAENTAIQMAAEWLRVSAEVLSQRATAFALNKGQRNPFWKMSLGKSECMSRTSVQGKGKPVMSCKTSSVLAVSRAVWDWQHSTESWICLLRTL